MITKGHSITHSDRFSVCNLIPWWRHQMEAFSALLNLFCGEFIGHLWIPLTKGQLCGLWCFFYVGPQKLSNKQSNGRWFKTTWRPCDVIVMPWSRLKTIRRLHVWIFIGSKFDSIVALTHAEFPSNKKTTDPCSYSLGILEKPVSISPFDVKIWTNHRQIDGRWIPWIHRAKGP